MAAGEDDDLPAGPKTYTVADIDGQLDYTDQIWDIIDGYRLPEEDIEIDLDEHGSRRIYNGDLLDDNTGEPYRQEISLGNINAQMRDGDARYLMGHTEFAAIAPLIQADAYEGVSFLDRMSADAVDELYAAVTGEGDRELGNLALDAAYQNPGARGGHTYVHGNLPGDLNLPDDPDDRYDEIDNAINEPFRDAVAAVQDAYRDWQEGSRSYEQWRTALEEGAVTHQGRQYTKQDLLDQMYAVAQGANVEEDGIVFEDDGFLPWVEAQDAELLGGDGFPFDELFFAGLDQVNQGQQQIVGHDRRRGLAERGNVRHANSYEAARDGRAYVAVEEPGRTYALEVDVDQGVVLGPREFGDGAPGGGDDEGDDEYEGPEVDIDFNLDWETEVDLQRTSTLKELVGSTNRAREIRRGLLEDEMVEYDDSGEPVGASQVIDYILGDEQTLDPDYFIDIGAEEAILEDIDGFSLDDLQFRLDIAPVETTLERETGRLGRRSETTPIPDEDAAVSHYLDIGEQAYLDRERIHGAGDDNYGRMYPNPKPAESLINSLDDEYTGDFVINAQVVWDRDPTYGGEDVVQWQGAEPHDDILRNEDGDKLMTGYRYDTVEGYEPLEEIDYRTAWYGLFGKRDVPLSKAMAYSIPGTWAIRKGAGFLNRHVPTPRGISEEWLADRLNW